VYEGLNTLLNVVARINCNNITGGTNLIESDFEELKKRVEQLEACCRELREKIRPEKLVPDIYEFDDELARRLKGRL
jgi:hypothetical protein